MKLSDYAIEQLCKFVMGDEPFHPYRKGKKLVDLFN